MKYFKVQADYNSPKP